MAYNFKVKYLPGHQNIVDCLSRLVVGIAYSQDMEVEEYVKFQAKEATPRAISTREIEKAYRKDEDLMSFRKSIQDNKWDKSCEN